MDKDAYAFDTHDKDPEDDGRIFEKEGVGQEAEYESSGSEGEHDEEDNDGNPIAAVLGEPAREEEVEEKGGAGEADKEVAQPGRLNADLLFQQRCNPQVTQHIPGCRQEAEDE